MMAVTDASAQPSQPGPAPAEDTLQVNLGAGALAFSAYPGSGRARVLPLPYLDATYAETAFVSFPELLRVDALRALGIEAEGLSAGPLLRFNFGRRERDNQRGLRGFGDVDAAPELGGYVSYAFGGGLSARVTATNAIGGHEGFVGNIGISYAAAILGPVFAVLTPSVTIVDARYGRAFYGIDRAQAVRSGRPTFRAGAGIERAGISAVLTLPVSDRVSLVALGDYARLLGDAADSPITRGPGGSRDVFAAGLFLTYRLY
jgi:outer membrane scaffolding protein for murein synthesis (MipA/OmpV family)